MIGWSPDRDEVSLREDQPATHILSKQAIKTELVTGRKNQIFIVKIN